MTDLLEDKPNPLLFANLLTMNDPRMQMQLGHVNNQQGTHGHLASKELDFNIHAQPHLIKEPVPARRSVVVMRQGRERHGIDAPKQAVSFNKTDREGGVATGNELQATRLFQEGRDHNLNNDHMHTGTVRSCISPSSMEQPKAPAPRRHILPIRHSKKLNTTAPHSTTTVPSQASSKEIHNQNATEPVHTNNKDPQPQPSPRSKRRREESPDEPESDSSDSDVPERYFKKVRLMPYHHALPAEPLVIESKKACEVEDLAAGLADDPLGQFWKKCQSVTDYRMHLRSRIYSIQDMLGCLDEKKVADAGFEVPLDLGELAEMIEELEKTRLSDGRLTPMRKDREKFGRYHIRKFVGQLNQSKIRPLKQIWFAMAGEEIPTTYSQLASIMDSL
ncbi:hypothetical protein BJ508DRAFT_351174 [Ascobolus immersus RN42]|uniref:Uncharacterized protein n=1 Tax=Ascobolus immersus RN42 TaxID=1160509 RepID=A0A3N4HWT3_ASCIM|nr:hypothetical protein BJ508DRAFT_351174 [Ascobolus immersus RN42]